MVSECDDGPDHGMAGLLPHAGVGVGEFAPLASYVGYGGTFMSDVGCLEPPRADGTYELRAFHRRSPTSIWGWVFHVQYAPNALPAMVYAGAGFETEGNEFIVAGAAVRRRAPLSVFGGAEVAHFRTPYILRREVWQNGEVVTRTDLRSDVSWRRMVALRAGIEYRWRFASR